MKFGDAYTTASKKAKDSQKEKDKVELTEDAFALGEQIEKLNETIRLGRLYGSNLH